MDFFDNMGYYEKIYYYFFIFLIATSDSLFAQEISCSSPMVLKTVNDNLHTHATIRNTKLKERSILDVPVDFFEFSDSVPGRYGYLSCFASVSLKVDKNVTQLLSNEDLKYSKLAHQIASDYLPYYDVNSINQNDGYLSFTGFHYIIYFNDDNSLKNIEIDANNRVSYAIYGVAWFNENAKKIKSEIAENAYIEAEKDFKIADNNINIIYNNLPHLIKSSLREEMRNWIREKNRKCGKVEHLTNPEISFITKTKIYRCQTEMTKKQIERLTE